MKTTTIEKWHRLCQELKQEALETKNTSGIESCINSLIDLTNETSDEIKRGRRAMEQKYFIGQRVIYNGDEVATIINPPYKDSELNDDRQQWIMRAAVGYQSYVSRSNLKPLPNGQL